MARPTLVACVLACGTLVAVPARGQGISATDQREASRFDLVVRAATQAGYTHPLVVGHGDGATAALFALLATRNGSGVLIALAESAGHTSARPVELEHDQTPAQIGIRGVQFTAFLGAPDLFDLVVTHEPFMLETSRRFETHHVLRRRGTRLASVCEFPGADVSSSSKGIGSITAERHVTVALLLGGGGASLRFLVRTIDETTEQSSGQAAPVITAHRESTRRYDLPATGACREMPSGP